MSPSKKRSLVTGKRLLLRICRATEHIYHLQSSILYFLSFFYAAPKKWIVMSSFRMTQRSSWLTTQSKEPQIDPLVSFDVKQQSSGAFTAADIQESHLSSSTIGDYLCWIYTKCYLIRSTYVMINKTWMNEWMNVHFAYWLEFYLNRDWL